MVTRPKGKLAALLAIFAAIGLVTATGAFTSVSAQRTADVNVSGDSSALVALSENTTAGVTSGVVSKSNGEISLDFSNGANGINLDATTKFNSVLDITNNGASSTTLDVDLTDTTGDDTDGSAENEANLISVIAVNQTASGSKVTNLEESGNTVSLASGETVTLSFKFNTKPAGNIKGDDILDTMTINAN